MRKITPFFMVFSLLLSAPALAAPVIDATGAATLKKQIEDDLQWRSDMSKIVGQGLIVDGKTAVTPKSSFYEVNLPHLFITFAGKQPGKIDAGNIRLNVAPAPEAGAWLIQQITLPPSMMVYDDKNAPAAAISIGKQRFTATWEPDKGLFSKVDSLLQNIKVTGSEKNAPTINIAALKTLVNLKDNGDGTWSGPADVGAANIAIDVPGQNPISLGAGKVTFRNVYDQLDTRTGLKMKEEARQALKAGAPQTDQQKKAFLAKYLLQNPMDAHGVSTTFEIGQFLMHDTGTQQQPPREIKFDQLVMSGLTPNMKLDKNKVLLKAAFQGLHVSFVPALLAGLMPTTMNMEITFDNLPISRITGQFIELARKQASETGAATPKQSQAKVNDAVSQLPNILEDAGASITINETYAKSDSLSASLQGKLEASSKAALGLTGKVAMVIKGLDELVQKVQDGALKPGSDPQLLGYLMGVMTLQTKGQQDKAADGTSIRNYTVELKANGDMLLNGAVVNPKKTSTVPAASKKP